MKFVDELLDQAKQYLNDIENLSKIQMELLYDGEFEQLVDVLESKDFILKRLTAIQSSFSLPKDALNGDKYTITNNTITKIADITNVVRSIIKDDQNSLHKAMENKNKTYTILQKIVQGRKLINKYRQKGLHTKHSKQWNG